MLLVKSLLLLAGSASIAGVTYSQIQKDPDTKAVVVSNNHESMVRAKFEKKLDTDLLEHQKNLLNSRKSSNTDIVNTAKSHLDVAETALQNAYKELNKDKKTLNDTSQQLKSKYEGLQTKDQGFVEALKSYMQFELKKKEKELTKAFYDAQKNTYEKEKTSIVAKINNIEDPTNTTNADGVCSDGSTSWTLTTTYTNKTSEEAIETEINAELGLVCVGLKNATTKSTDNNTHSPSSPQTEKQIFESSKTDREKIIKEISNLTRTYNSTVIDIKSKENDVNMKLFHFQNKQEIYAAAKKRLQETENQLELINEKIRNY